MSEYTTMQEIEEVFDLCQNDVCRLNESEDEDKYNASVLMAAFPKLPMCRMMIERFFDEPVVICEMISREVVDVLGQFILNREEPPIVKFLSDIQDIFHGQLLSMQRKRSDVLGIWRTADNSMVIGAFYAPGDDYELKLYFACAKAAGDVLLPILEAVQGEKLPPAYN